MQVSIRGRKLNFDPATLEWRHQSSPQTRFGVWKSPQGEIFVKRFQNRPTGWDLLGRLKGKKLNNTPEVLDLIEEENRYLAFFEWLDGDILSQVLKNGQTNAYFGTSGLDETTKTNLFISIYGTFFNLHKLDFWYPDLDFKNVFITRKKSGFRAFLIDIDSCVKFGEPSNLDQVSQRFWQGLVHTYLEAGKPFLKKGSGDFVRDISAHGRCLNQSMILLLAYAVKRLGQVPLEAPLFPLLTSPKNPISKEVIRLHAGWLNNRNQDQELRSWLENYFKLTPEEFSRKISELAPPSPTGIGALFSRLFGN